LVVVEGLQVILCPALIPESALATILNPCGYTPLFAPVMRYVFEEAISMGVTSGS
jgi:hypothetical protein